MAVKSKNPKIAIKNPDLRQYVAGQIRIESMTDSGSAIAAGDVCELTSGQIKIGTEQNTAFLGVTRAAIAAGETGTVEWGFVPAKLASPVAKSDRLAPRADGRVGKAQAAQDTLLNAAAGGNYANQPANDGIEIVSDAAGDTTQTITLYGLRNGALTTLVTETVTLTGTAAVSSTITDWYTLCAARLSAACAGTITIREASGNATITTISAGDTTSGISASATSQAYGLVLRHDASGSSTAAVVAVGKGIDGAALSVVDTLNSTTEEDHGSTPFATVTEFYIGAVASTVNVTFLTNEAADSSCYCGIALDTSTVAGTVIDCFIKPYWM